MWRTLHTLRDFFLSGLPSNAPYWDSLETLDLYDRTFAERIRWKWNAVVAQLESLRWQPVDLPWLDWGCGTGIAARAFAGRFLPRHRVYFDDWSDAARDYARSRFHEEFPGYEVQLGRPLSGRYLLLLSHVLSELGSEGFQQLGAIIEHAEAVVWVEPGNSVTARRLVEWRERLRSAFSVVAPCTHQARCGMLTEANVRHWCHFFASAPPDVFVSAEWAAFGHKLGIDLRSLPHSYLVLDRRPIASAAGRARLIGRNRVYKATAKLQVCDENGVRDLELHKRDDPEQFKELRKGRLPTRIRIAEAGGRIRRIETL
jgi:SAM-dependent methyltransferase